MLLMEKRARRASIVLSGEGSGWGGYWSLSQLSLGGDGGVTPQTSQQAVDEVEMI